MSGRFLAWMAAAGMVAMASPAYAATIEITPATDEKWTIDGSANPDAGDLCDLFDIGEIAGLCVLQDGLYKANVPEEGSGDPVDEEGSWLGSYETTFDNDPEDPSEATIEYTGGDSFVCPGGFCFLIVKDGNQNPGVYIFNLNNIEGAAWNGTDTLHLTGFWPNQGAISHVEIMNFEGENFRVPEPTSMAMFGFGLAAVFARRLRKGRAKA